MKKILSIISFSLLLLLLMAVPLTADAQQDTTMCAITATRGGDPFNLSEYICPESGKDISLSVPSMPNRIYRWTNDQSSETKTTPFITVHPATTTTYHVMVVDTLNQDTCSNHAQILVHLPFNTRIDQLKLTCSNSESDFGNTAQIQASASYTSGGGGPFLFEWVDIPHYQQIGDTIAIGLQAYREYKVKITDTSCGCTQIAKKTTKGFPTPDVEISTDQGDTVYLQNPDVTFMFENHSADSIAITDFFWTFEHGITSTQDRPTFTYVQPQTFTASLTVTDDCGCDTTFNKEIYVLPVNLNIPTVFTPNGDTKNDYFVITVEDRKNDKDPMPLNDFYKSSELVVFNRWGRIVYKSSNYQNDWDGGGLSDGTYFYVLKCRGLKEEVQYQGSVMILTKSE